MNIVFDIGGTNMRIATASGRTLGEITKVPTPKDSHEGMAKFAEIARGLAGTASVATLAGSISGRVDAEGVVYGARNLTAWNGLNIVEELSKIFGVPARVVNDCEIVGLGEAHEGAGKGASVLAYVTVSTGVGGACIVDGKIDFAATDFLVGSIPLRGSDLEDLVSGTAVRKKFGVEPKDLESIDERNALADILAEGLVKVVEKWSPDTIVLGGSMIVGKNPIPLERVTESLARLVAQPPVLKMAQLGDNGGLIGAAILAEEGLPAGKAGLSTA